MQTSSVIIILIILVMLLLVLVIIYTYEPSEKKRKKQATNTQEKIRVKPRSFDELYTIIKTKSTSQHDLKVASEEILDNYAKITPKLGVRAHPDFDKYATIIMSLCRHPNTDKNIILNFDKKLQLANKEYKQDIENFLARGLSSRGL